MRMSQAQIDWFQKMRKQWFEVMLPLAGFGAGELFAPLSIPDQSLLSGCTLLSDREQILHRLPKGGVGAEVGTQEGYFAEKMITICEPVELHLFDLSFEPLLARGVIETTGRAELHEGDSSTMLAKFPEEYFDWIYIDGDHSFSGALRDIAVAKTRVKRGGIVIFNDFTMWSPVECIDYGVCDVVCQLSAGEKWPFVYFALHPLMYCDVALRRP